MIKGKLSIGWKQVDITPARKVLVQGQFHTRISDQIISPLTATALALETCSEEGAIEQAIFLSCDLASEHFKTDLLKKLEGKLQGFDPAKLTINATHTHTAPSMQRGIYDEPEGDPEFMDPDSYRDWLTDQLAKAVATAWQERLPGGISRGFGYAVTGRCRRVVYADGSSRMYGTTNRPDFHALEACDDQAVNLLFTHDEAGDLTGIVVNIACPSQCDESKSDISADFWHEVRGLIAERFGPRVQLLPQCAPAGDVSPHLLLDQTEERDLRDRMKVNDKEVIAHRIMAAVQEAWSFRSPTESEVAFHHTVKSLPLPRLEVSKEEYEIEKRIPTMTEEERKKQPWGFDRLWPFGPVCKLAERYEQQGEQPVHETECHVIRLGDVAFATNPFELFTDYGIRMRARSKALQTFNVQLADGSGNGFYLPTQRALDGGHYSALIKSNWVGPEAGQMLVDQTVDAINALFEGEEYPRTR